MSSRPAPPRRTVLALCAVPVAGLLAVAALAPLPFAVAQPGVTADVLGEHRGEPVITVSGRETAERGADGRLLMTTIAATTPETPVRLADVVSGWFARDRAVMPKEAVYPTGNSPAEIRRHNAAQMEKSQNAAVSAALRQLRLSTDDVDVELRLEDIGGPSAGLLFALGLVETLDGDGRGGELTGGRVIAGTGTIRADGTVGPVGGVPLKTQAARRDGATVFLVPEAECAAAKAERPDGLRLVPVRTLKGAIDALKALGDGGRVPSC
ncbi:S16 family serine protease [Streptomyces alkaliterrae]|uniref:Lon proteolytic domain-containing protein n=1 Tax=Streptomyces alkaliterrae TaxID=2213162 RepID=A0A5P0YV22_9ACTN|nr:S16 family serine protease [Streptomyces alkaliterrae]MBB1255712.1 hypothetical protein [Streptomyces alkaliterrae]MBB1261404.1 hypothetical protein [Streptomyces alkaliterrae]MQS04145.1 hypothetical protein [Streptomyces alkaliterrae]